MVRPKEMKRKRDWQTIFDSNTLREDTAMARISGVHHLTLSTDGVQQDHDFYTKTPGLYAVKRTVLFGGGLPV